MIFAFVLVLVLALVVAVIIGVAKDPGPTPVEIALGYEHAWEVLDFDALYRMSGSELHDGLRKADWVAAKRTASAAGAAVAHLVEDVAADEELVEGDAAVVTTRLTMRDGSVVHNEVRMLRRSRRVGGRRVRASPVERGLSSSVPIPGLLLTGGASSRMGVPKATLLVDGETLVARAARSLQAVCEPVVEVGPGYSDLPRVDESSPGRGPLAALVAGADAVGDEHGMLLLACDLPFVTEALLGRLVRWPGPGTVVPVDADGALQPVCAAVLGGDDRARRAGGWPTDSGHCDRSSWART